MKQFLDAIQLPAATLFAQDWGGLIGLRVAAENPDRFDRIAMTLVPTTPEHGGVAENVAAWEVFDRWEKPMLTLWCPDDQVLGQLHHEFIERVPGASGQPHQEFRPGGHFLQDDRGEDVAAALVSWLA